MKKTTEDKPKRKRISKADKNETVETSFINDVSKGIAHLATFPENTPIVSLRGETLYQDKDYIFFNDEWHHIANGETWEQLKKHNSWIKTKKKYISKEKLATLKIGIPLSI